MNRQLLFRSLRQKPRKGILMPSYGLQSLYTTNLTTAELAQLADDTADAVTSFTQTNNKELLLAGQLVKLKGSLRTYQTAQQGQKKTTTASQLEVADSERDQALATLNAFVKANAYIKTEAIKTAYGKLSALLKTYKKTSSKSYEEQTADLTKLLAQLKSSDYQPAVTTLGLTAHVTTLETAQTSFERLYGERIKEQSKTTPGQLKALRKDLEKAYGTVVDLIAIHSYCQPDHAAYADLLKTVNTLRGRYRG